MNVCLTSDWNGCCTRANSWRRVWDCLSSDAKVAGANKRNNRKLFGRGENPLVEAPSLLSEIWKL